MRSLAIGSKKNQTDNNNNSIHSLVGESRVANAWARVRFPVNASF